MQLNEIVLSYAPTVVNDSRCLRIVVDDNLKKYGVSDLYATIDANDATYNDLLDKHVTSPLFGKILSGFTVLQTGESVSGSATIDTTKVFKAVFTDISEQTLEYYDLPFLPDILYEYGVSLADDSVVIGTKPLRKMVLPVGCIGWSGNDIRLTQNKRLCYDQLVNNWFFLDTSLVHGGTTMADLLSAENMSYFATNSTWAYGGPGLFKILIRDDSKSTPTAAILSAVGSSNSRNVGLGSDGVVYLPDGWRWSDTTPTDLIHLEPSYGETDVTTYNEIVYHLVIQTDLSLVMWVKDGATTATDGAGRPLEYDSSTGKWGGV